MMVESKVTNSGGGSWEVVTVQAMKEKKTKIFLMIGGEDETYRPKFISILAVIVKTIQGSFLLSFIKICQAVISWSGHLVQQTGTT